MDPAKDGILYELSNSEILRLDVDDEHYYYGRVPGGPEEYYLSVTKVLDIAGPFPEGLRQYLRVTTYEEQQDRLAYTAGRGIKLHGALENLMQAQELELKEFATTYEKDAVVTFIRFMRFLNPAKFNTELIVADPDLRMAGTLDFEGWVDAWRLTALAEPTKYLELDADNDLQLKEKWLDLPKDTKRIRVVLDWKFTGRSQYSHLVQVAAYKTMFNKSRNGQASRAFTWRYSPRHKFGYDFNESPFDYRSFKRIYDTAIEYLSGFPEPPVLKRYPERVRLYQKHEPTTTTKRGPGADDGSGVPRSPGPQVHSHTKPHVHAAHEPENEKRPAGRARRTAGPAGSVAG